MILNDGRYVIFYLFIIILYVFLSQLITIMMDSNTYCLELCYEDYTKFPEQHRKDVMTALLYIKEQLPRTLVNLVLSPSK